MFFSDYCKYLPTPGLHFTAAFVSGRSKKKSSGGEGDTKAPRLRRHAGLLHGGPQPQWERIPRPPGNSSTGVCVFYIVLRRIVFSDMNTHYLHSSYANLLDAFKFNANLSYLTHG